MQSKNLLPASIQYIINGLKVERNRSPLGLMRLIENAQVQEEELKPWATFDHPAADSYGRQLVFAGDGFEVMVMSWLPGDFSAIHDHGHAQWGAVQIFGAAEHATFRIHNNTLETTARWSVVPGSVLPVQHDLIHQMGNPGAARFLSLHVYGLETDHESITGDARIFDPVEGKIHRVDGGVFFALPAEEIERTESGYRGDYATRLRFLVEDIHRRLSMPSYQYGTKAAALEASVRELFGGAFCAHRRLANKSLEQSTTTLSQEIQAAERLANRWQKLRSATTEILEC